MSFLLAGLAPPTLQGPASRAPTPGDLVINEILYDPPGTQVEFVELHNRSDRTLRLRRLQIADSRRQPISVDGGDLRIKPGGFFVIVPNENMFQAHFPDVAVLTADPWPALNNGGDAVRLYAGGAAIDSVEYRPDWGGRAVSLERVDPAGPSHSPYNWRTSTASAGSTPGRRNSVYAPDTSGPRVIFAEQLSAQTILLHVSEPIAPASTDPRGFSCGADARTVGVHFRDDGRQIELRLSAPPTADECSVGPLRDLAGNQTPRASIPLAYLPGPGDVVISEIMYQPRQDPFDDSPDQPEYIELRNRSERRITVRDLYWTDRPDETGAKDTVRVGRRQKAVPEDGFAVAFADPEAIGGLVLRRAFPGPTPPICLLPVHRQSLGLRNSGETIRLHGPDGTVLDTLHYTPDWHHLDIVDAEGTALERISLDAPSAARSNWSSSTARSGGTPGRPNTIVPATANDRSGDALQVGPSPFSPDGDGYEDHTLVDYNLPHPTASLRIRIFDVRGYLVRTLAAVRLSASSGTVVWDGRDDQARLLPSGIYVVLLETVDAGGGTVDYQKAPVVLARPR